jgi:hypothetical protein
MTWSSTSAPLPYVLHSIAASLGASVLRIMSWNAPQCIEGDESGRVGDWNTKMQNCLTDEERVVVKECFNTRSKDLLIEVAPWE